MKHELGIGLGILMGTASLLMAGNTASITFSGTVTPRVEAQILTYSAVPATVQSTSTNQPVAVIRCSQTIPHQVIVESGSKRQVLQQEQRTAGQSEYLVFANPRSEAVTVTVIAD